MSDIWETKDGLRRVRRDPPTVEDAVLAAQGMTDDLDGQVEIVASLMQLSAEEARGAVLKMGQRKDVSRFTIAGRNGMERAVVVERRNVRRFGVPPKASAGSRGRI
jgi:predicted site-specific integrase-resolvase